MLVGACSRNANELGALKLLGLRWSFYTLFSTPPSSLLSAICRQFFVAKMSLKHETDAAVEKDATLDPEYERPHSFSEHVRGRQFSVDPEDQAILAADQNALHRKLKGRHMQMIAM